jgi:hypothetical protein
MVRLLQRQGVAESDLAEVEHHLDEAWDHLHQARKWLSSAEKEFTASE